MNRILLVIALGAILPLGGAGVHVQLADGEPYAVAGEADGMPPCCAPAAGDALACAGPGTLSCSAPAVATATSLRLARVGDSVPAAGATARYRSPTLPGLFRPPIAART